MPASADADGYGRTIAATLLLALDAASTCDPEGLARPAIRLAALLDPAGHPLALWETSSVTRYLTQYRDSGAHPARYRLRRWVRPGKRITAAQAREAVLLLHRYGLATFDDQAGPRAIRIHALTARAARETTPTQQAQGIAVAAADALAAAWPDPDITDPALADALRASTIFLSGYAIDSLWHRGRVGLLYIDLLYKAGESLMNVGMYGAAITYWLRLITDLERIRSSRNGDLGIAVARANLAGAYRAAGRAAEAITIDEQVVADLTRLLGPRDSGTLSARWNLALSYHEAGRSAEAVTIDEQTAASLTRARGSDHSSTLTARADLAFTYLQAGRTAEAITISEQAVAGLTRILGPDHYETLMARAGLAAAYWEDRRIADAITISEQVAAGMARTRGPDHFDTLAARVFLAHSYWDDGRTAEAIAIFEQDVTGLTRTRGPSHPDTLMAGETLALHYRLAGRTVDAITIGEQVAADMARVLGPDHPRTVAVFSALKEWRNRP